MTAGVRRLGWRVVLAGAAVLALAACAGGSDDDRAQVIVEMGDNWFEPEELVVEPGTEVVFENTGETVHNAIHVDGDWQTRDVIEPGESDAVTIDEPGEYLYYCSFHAPSDASAGQVGTIEVSEEAEAAAAPDGEPAQPVPGDVEPVEPTGETRRVPADYPTIQAGVDAAAPGDLVLVDEGVYREQVDVATEQIVLRGVDRGEVIIDGEFERDMGVLVTADGVAVENMTARNANANGFYWTSVNGYRGSYLTAVNNAVYGIYAFDSVDGVFEHSYASGSADAGFYIGQCDECHAVLNEVTAEHNGAGYSGTNSAGVTIVNSVWRGNGAGIVPNTLDSQRYPPSRGNTIAGNLVEESGHHPTPVVGAVWGARGAGIILAAGQGHEIRDNVVRGNARFGIAAAPNLSDRIWFSGDNAIRDNEVRGSGWADLAVIAPSRDGGDCFAGNQAERTLPALAERAGDCDGWSVPSLGSFRQLWTMIGHVAAFPGRTTPQEMLDDLPDPPPQPQLPGGADAPVRPAADVVATYDAVEGAAVEAPGVEAEDERDRSLVLAGVPVAELTGWQWYFVGAGWLLPAAGLLGLAGVGLRDAWRRDDLRARGRRVWTLALAVPALVMLVTWWPIAVAVSGAASLAYLVGGRPAMGGPRRWAVLGGGLGLIVVAPAVLIVAGLLASGVL